ncbi:MAG TPA: C4-type zinc ribbon domain-containing protein [Thermoanaerobaculia bacterium]
MKEVYDALLELQDLDREIAKARRRVTEAEAELAEAVKPVTDLEKEVAALHTELEDTRGKARKLERAAETKRERLKQYEERMTRVRNAREEAAVQTEVDLVRKAAETDEAEALTMMDQTTRKELKASELAGRLDTTRKDVAPQETELTQKKDEAAAALADLQDRRTARISKLEPTAREAYTRAMGGKKGQVVAALTRDGACGNCYSVLPLQKQSEVRAATKIVRCEFCGVILHPGDQAA